MRKDEVNSNEFREWIRVLMPLIIVILKELLKQL